MTAKGAGTTTIKVIVDKTYSTSYNVTVSDGYPIAFAKCLHGNIETTSVQAKSGQNVTLTAKPEGNYQLYSVRIIDNNGNSVRNEIVDGKVEFVMPQSGVRVIATFGLCKYPINITENEHGQISSSKSSYSVGEPVTLSINPDADFELSELFVNSEGNSIDYEITGNKAMFIMPSSDVTNRAIFKKHLHEVIIDTESKNAITVIPSKAGEGETVTLIGDMFDEIEVLDAEGNKVDCHVNGPIAVFMMPTSEVTVSATFTEATMAVWTSNEGYATFYDSKWAAELPNDLQAQVVTNISNGKLNYQTLTGGVVPKDVAVMLSSGQKRSAEYTLTRTESDATYGGTNLLRGSDEATMTTGDGLHYKLAFGPSTDSKLKNVFGWYWGTNGGAPFQIEGHKAWLVVPQSAGARTRGFTVEGDALGISQAEESWDGPDTFFDLQGRHVQQPTRKGIYISNGKKIVNK